MDGLQLLTQASFESGMFQSPDIQRIPRDGAYDVVNGLVDADEGVIYRRGGCAYKSTVDTTNTIRGLWDGILSEARRTVFYTDDRIYVLDTDDHTSLLLSTAFHLSPSKRPVVLQNMVILPTSTGGGVAYAGSKKAAYPNNLTFTAGSNHVTGTGFTANVDVGMFLPEPGHQEAVHIVVSIDDDHTVTLDTDVLYSVVGAGQFEPVWDVALSLSASAGLGGANVIGAVAGRLLLSSRNDLYFTNAGVPFVFTDGDFHRLSAPPLAAVRSGGSALVFALDGVWEIRNMAFDLTDWSGNPQQELRKVTGDIVLWGELGLTEWNNAAVVPAVDDIYVFDGVSSPVPVGSSIRGRYRAHVAAGHRPGQATVFRGHYLLPVLDGANNSVDLLVCKLEGARWTRWADFAGASVALAPRVGEGASRQPLLLAARGLRLLDLTGCFSPAAANKNEADGSTHAFEITTRDFTLSSLRALCRRIRLWVEGVDAGADNPTISASYAVGLAGSAFTAMTGTGGSSTGDAPDKWWRVNRRGKRVRFKFRSTSPWASLKIKALDVFVRPSGTP